MTKSFEFGGGGGGGERAAGKERGFLISRERIAEGMMFCRMESLL